MIQCFLLEKAMNNEVSRGYRLSAAITRQHAKTFYFCSLFLSKEKRLSAYAVYAFSRNIDDTFDSSSSAGQKEVSAWLNSIDRVYGNTPLEDPVLIAVRNTVNKYDIPAEYFRDLVKGMEMDLTMNRYRDFAGLYEYCYRVAGVIGLIMIKILGYSSGDALLYAEKTGIAMQLTNILRDIKEDLAMGRIYLPSGELGKYGVAESDLSSGAVTGPFKDLLRFQIERARSYYREGFRGIKLIPGANARFIAKLMSNMYAGILERIEKNDYDIFSGRCYVSFLGKIAITVKTLVNRRCF